MTKRRHLYNGDSFTEDVQSGLLLEYTSHKIGIAIEKARFEKTILALYNGDYRWAFNTDPTLKRIILKDCILLIATKNALELYNNDLVKLFKRQLENTEYTLHNITIEGITYVILKIET